MITEIARLAISHLNQYGFEAFVKYLLEHDSCFINARQLIEIDERIIECPPERFFQSADVFLLNYQPMTFYQEFSLKKINLCEIESLLIKYFNKRKYDLWLPTDGTTINFVSNYDSSTTGVSTDQLLEYFETHFRNLLPPDVRLGLGTVDTFLDAMENNGIDGNETISNFFRRMNDGLSISISEEGISAAYFLSENEFSGVTAKSKSIVHPVMKLISRSNVLDEFNSLLNTDSKEKDIEEFLQANYRLIFGEKYDSIATQLWIKFPELDIGNSNRRLDVFMRNSVSSDWELFELKRPSIPLTKTIRDVPMFTSAVTEAIAQVRNYKSLLSQESVRRQFAKEGIEYFHPEINLVIGRKPEITNEQWRRIIKDETALKILTYDDLHKSAENRLRALAHLIM